MIGRFSRLIKVPRERLFIGSALILLAIVSTAFGKSGGNQRSEATCEQTIPAITSGFGSDGPYAMEMRSVKNPVFRRKNVLVFLPKGAPGKRPVVFFSHGYGPNRWSGYEALIRHIVSRGMIVVYSTYPMIFSSNDGRYNSLWRGFESAVDHDGSRMDLTRVGFLGHSFGGGATPAMAYHGLVEKRWGSNGAFLMELAPWYEFEMTEAKWERFPKGIIQFVEVYDNDSVNDHRMAIEIFNQSRMARKYYYVVKSQTVGSCVLNADHATPGHNPNIRLKQYGVFRPFDALAAATLEQSADGLKALSTMGDQPGRGGYQPLKRELKPVPDQSQSRYRFPWSGKDNPARSNKP